MRCGTEGGDRPNRCGPWSEAKVRPAGRRVPVRVEVRGADGRAQIHPRLNGTHAAGGSGRPVAPPRDAYRRRRDLCRGPDRGCSGPASTDQCSATGSATTPLPTPCATAVAHGRPRLRRRRGLPPRSRPEEPADHPWAGTSYPAEIERVLHELPDVEACAVVGLPDERLGERVAVVVQLRDGCQRG